MPPCPRPRSAFFVALTLGFVGLAALGFGRTFFLPLAAGEFSRPARVVVHGALLFIWLLLLVGQAALAATGRMAWHRRLGWLGAGLVVPIFVTGLLVSAHAATAGAAGPHPHRHLAVLAGAMSSFTVFLVLAAAGFLARGSPQIHKRLLVVAPLPLLGAGVARIPWLSAYSDWVTTGLLGLVVVHDLVRLRRVHPATVVAGAAFLVDTWVGPSMKQTEAAVAVARGLMEVLGLLPPG
jgi:hypothetical protein